MRLAMTLLARFALGLFLSALIAFAAHRRGSLSTSGAAGAVLVGTAIFGFGGWVWGLVLITFFVLSTLLSHYKESDKEALAEKFDKGHQRDLGQTLANGGMGALLALGYWLHPHPALWAAFVGTMAAVNADTWATELGVLSRNPPKLITTWRVVERGASGGISVPGTLAALVGALAIGAAAWGLGAVDGWLGGAGMIVGWMPLLLAAGLGGVAGALFDSLLGATVQAIYFCPTCEKETEKTLHTCGTPTRQTRGWRWLDNDWVNFISSVVGALTAMLALSALG
jgi:uncharacterized protein (TIGR00297 family)